jgi:hypothetical protein
MSATASCARPASSTQGSGDTLGHTPAAAAAAAVGENPCWLPGRPVGAVSWLCGGGARLATGMVAWGLRGQPTATCMQYDTGRGWTCKPLYGQELAKTCSRPTVRNFSVEGYCHPC